jgi:hypothetical protein
MICLFLSDRLSTDWIKSVESRILTSTFWSQHGLPLILCFLSLQLCPPMLFMITVWILERSISRSHTVHHQVLRWLPTKLAEWIGANLCEVLNIPDKQGPLWTAVELNAIITGNLVGGSHGHLHTFGCIQWENELFNGRPKARCYPFNIQGHRFRNKNPLVHSVYRTRYRYHYRVKLA